MLEILLIVFQLCGYGTVSEATNSVEHKLES